MLSLASKLREKVEAWRKAGYPSEYPAISEILEYAIIESNSEKTFRYLRKAQFEALETYWYLRLVEKTPHIFELYQRTFQNKELFESLGIRLTAEDLQELLFHSDKGGMAGVFERIKTDDEFVKKYKLESVRETLMLGYPSYILALAMGSGKTVLIGSIIAMEFAMSLEYPKADFVRNALVFAPGNTIVGALKEISDIPFEKILPPRFYKTFLSTVKITYTQTGEKNIPVTIGSSFNVVVTNTEKIRIQKQTNGKSTQLLLDFKQKEKNEEQEEIVNLRLQTIASLPRLAIFSDEAHHTYGQSLDSELKKVRKTVDYLSDKTNVIVVVNTTGTPYFKKQMLRDVVYWYGLSQGIRDGVLKEVKDNIVSFQDINSKEFLENVIISFFKDYSEIRTPDGIPSKLAIYFPQIDDLKEAKPIVEKTIIGMHQDPSILLEVTSKSPADIKDLFDNRINDTGNPYRVFLLVNKGTEGWNCPSLFATALARKLTSSNNFVLQAATRCLRQIPGNRVKARIFISKENVNVLDAQLKETFGEGLDIISTTPQEVRKERLILRKTNIPPFAIKKKVKKVVVRKNAITTVDLKLPEIEQKSGTMIIYEAREGGKKILTEKEKSVIESQKEEEDIYNVALDLSSVYRLRIENILNSLRRIYPAGTVPISHMQDIMGQIESQLRNYEIKDEEVEVALAIVRPDGFNKENINGNTVYTTEIIYHKDKEDLLLRFEEFKKLKSDFGFHYTPYNFDSKPEKDFFLRLLSALEEKPDDVEDIYFTGAITDPNKTDFFIEYQDKTGKWRNYTPDFLIKKKDGRLLIVEIKAERFRDERKEMAIKELEGLNPNKLKYEIVFTENDEVKFSDYDKVRKLIYGGVLK